MDKKTQVINDGINLLKFIAIVMVILIHEPLPGTLGIVAKGISAMSVPVFFMISGYFSYGVSFDKLKKRCARILKLTILANIIYFIWDICVEYISGASVILWIRDNCALKKLLVLILTNESPFRGHLWFLGALCYAYLAWLVWLMYVEKSGQHLAKILRKNKIGYMFAISLLLLVMNIAGGEMLTFFGKNIQIPYIRNWVFTGVPFFGIAYCIHAYEESIFTRIKPRSMFIIFLVSVLLNIVEVWFMPPSGVYITTIFVNISSFLIALRSKELKSPMLVKLGGFADRYGLWIYVLQIMVIKSMRRIYEIAGIGDTAVIDYLRPFIALMLSFITAVAVVWISGAIKKYSRKLRSSDLRL